MRRAAGRLSGEGNRPEEHMTSRIPKLILAAAVAATLPAAAAADDCHRERPAAWAAPARPPTPPPHRWREAARERELQQVRAELRALDLERAEFHARHARQPRKLRRYDASWAERRAEVERRFWQLQQVAFR
jgi:hypothetical protein